MSYKDIRNVNVNGEDIPIGHPNMASCYLSDCGSTIEFTVYSCKQNSYGGPLCIHVWESAGSGDGMATIVFPLSDCRVYGNINNYTCSATKKNLYPEHVFVEYYETKEELETAVGEGLVPPCDGSFCVVSVNFDDATRVSANVIADIEGVAINKGRVQGMDNPCVQTLSCAPNVLRSGIDYGDALPSAGTEGRIFFVLAD